MRSKRPVARTATTQTPTTDESPTRTRILTAARKLLARKGIEQLSMRTVADKAQVSLGLANYHFGSREGLLQAAIAASREAFLGKARVSPIEGDGPETLRRILELTAYLVRLMPDWYRVVIDLDALGLRNPSFRGTAAASRIRGEQDVSGFLQLIASRFGKPAADVTHLARVLHAAFDGLAVRALLEPDFDLLGAYQTLEVMILGVLAPGTRPPRRPWDQDPLRAERATGRSTASGSRSVPQRRRR